MSLSEKLTNIKTNLTSLLSFANEKTGQNDTDLGEAIRRLADGFGIGGSGFSVADLCATNAITEISDASITKVARPYAFSGMTALETVNLPMCTEMANYSFLNCTSLKNVNLSSLVNIGTNGFRSCSSLEEITLPSYNSRFDQSTFEGCTKLKKIDVKRLFFQTQTNNSIAQYALNCNNLETLIIRNDDYIARLSGTNSFGPATTKMNSGEGRIYVPRSMVDAYKENSVWANYSSQILAIEDYPEITGGL